MTSVPMQKYVNNFASHKFAIKRFLFDVQHLISLFFFRIYYNKVSMLVYLLFINHYNEFWVNKYLISTKYIKELENVENVALKSFK